MTYVILGFDIGFSIFLLMFTDGLDSGFLLYALAPIITAAVIFEARVAFIAAGLTSISLLIAHIGVSPWSSKYIWFMEELPLLAVYIIFCFLIVILSYRTNLNIGQRMETEAVLEERGRIRRELHDGVAQKLSYINMRTRSLKDSVSAQNTEQALAGLEDIRKTVKDTYEEVRQAMDSLSERAIFPLIPTLSEYVQEYGESNNLEAKFESPQKLPKISSMAELQLLRIAHEALTNVRKYAQATKVKVKLEAIPSGVEMTVTDNGKGFSFSDYEKSSAGHHGLNIMRERAEAVEGTFTILAAPEQGVEIKVKIPITQVRL